MEQFFALPDLPQHIRDLKRAERYKCFVWIAWRMYCNGYLPEMVESLEKSLYYTRLTGTETVFNWLESFKGVSEQYGYNFDAYALTNLQEWQDIMAIAANNPYQFQSAPSSIYRQQTKHVLLYTEDPGVGVWLKSTTR